MSHTTGPSLNSPVLTRNTQHSRSEEKKGDSGRANVDTDSIDTRTHRLTTELTSRSSNAPPSGDGAQAQQTPPRIAEYVPGTFQNLREEGQVPEPTPEDVRQVHASQFSNIVRSQLYDKLEQRHVEDHLAALEIAKAYCVPPLTPQGLLDRVIDHLQSAPLTTRFDIAGTDLDNFAKHGRYVNGFAPSLTHRDAGYLRRRNQVEEELFDLVRAYKAKPDGAFGRFLTSILQRFDPNFVPDSRPKYGALDLWNLPLERWGKSSIVWNDSLKINSTFTPRDTFYLQPGEGPCDFTHFEHLIATAQPSTDPRTPGFDVVDALFRHARGDTNFKVDSGHYIDVQIHGQTHVKNMQAINLYMDDVDQMLEAEVRNTPHGDYGSICAGFYDGVQKINDLWVTRNGRPLIYIEKSHDWNEA